MRVLFIGDIVGSPGREIVRERLADLVSQKKIDLVIANGENSASGFGITPKIVDELLGCGVEVIRCSRQRLVPRETMEIMPNEARLVRPANFPDGSAGSGMYVGTAKNGVKYGVINVQGRVFLPAIDDPFKKVDELLATLFADVAFVLVDVHAETTSEKIAMGWYVDGRATAVVGTHTHVATADEHVLPEGTAFITDVGMTRPHAGGVGMDKTAIIKKFLDG